MTTIFNLDILEALSRFQSTEAARPYLQGVYVDKETGCYVATDGHKLGCYADKTAADCPQSAILQVTKGLIKASKEYRKQFPARQRDRMELRLVVQGEFNPESSVYAKITHDTGADPAVLADQEPILLTFLNGPFPSWLRVVPSQLPIHNDRGTMSINPYYVESFALGNDRASVSFMPCSIDKNYMCTGAILVLNTAHKNFFGLLMPVRTVHSHESELLDGAPEFLRDRLGLKSYKPESQAA